MVLNLFLTTYIIARKSPCKQGLDLAILLDQSWSVSETSLQALLKSLLPSFLGMIGVSKRKTHVGFITFSSNSHFEFNFAKSNFQALPMLKAKISNMEGKTTFKTRIDHGLLSVRKELFTKRAGDRKNKQNVLLVFTDGRPYPPDDVLPFNETIPPLRVKY